MSEKKIEELTAAQEAALDSYAERFTKLGLSLDKIDQRQAEAAFAKAYTSQGLKAPLTVEWLPSPFAMLARGGALELRDELLGRGMPLEQAEKEADAEYDNSKTLSESSQQKIRELLTHCCFGQHEAGWLGWIEFFKTELGLTAETEELGGILDTVELAHWWLPFETACLASERPIECYFTEPDASGNRVLHRDGGAALFYSDGFALFMLNGVAVPEWLVTTPLDKLEPSKILALENAAQRKEGIQKIGIDRLREPLKVQAIDTWKDYELWTIEFEGRRIGPYLKMVNDSTGQIHVEGVGEMTDTGVDLKIKTCQEALAWRGGFKKYTEPGWTA